MEGQLATTTAPMMSDLVGGLKCSHLIYWFIHYSEDLLGPHTASNPHYCSLQPSLLRIVPISVQFLQSINPLSRFLTSLHYHLISDSPCSLFLGLLACIIPELYLILARWAAFSMAHPFSISAVEPACVTWTLWINLSLSLSFIIFY